MGALQVKYDEWLAADVLLTEYEIFLLEYCLRTGELVNRESLAAHWDTSNGHITETLDFIGIVDVDDDRDSATIAAVLADKVAQVWCPNQGHGYEVRPGREALHADFTKTVHVPDLSRGRTNLSRNKHTPTRWVVPA